jgi:autotransporter-associated beta strand protein
LKNGSGTLTLSGNNSFTGGLTLSDGRLNINSASALGGTASTFTITGGTFDNSTAAAITLANNNPQAWNNSFEFLGTRSLNTGTGAVTLGTSPAVTVTSNTLTIGGVIGDGGFGRGFTKEGAGVLKLTGSNTFSGTTRINAGTLELNGTSNSRVLQNSIVDLGGSGTLSNYGTTPVFGGLVNYSGFTLSGSVTRLTLNVAAGTTQTYATLPAGGASTIGFGKEGGGTLVFGGTFNYTGATNVDDGVLQVASLSAAGQPGPLGSGTTINLGAGATSGTLRYDGATSGSTNRTFNLAGTTGGGGIDASGVGALTVSSTVTGGNGAKVFTLSGTSTALNTIGTITGTGVSVTKSGPGTWRLGSGSSSFGGQFTLQEGTARVGVNSDNVLGTSNSAPIIGSGSSGIAALLLESGVTLTRTLTVPAGSGQTVLIGGVSGTTTYGSGKNLQLGRAVTLVAPTGGRVDFSNGWVNVDDTGTPAVNVTIGTADYTGRAFLQYGGTLATTGTVAVEYGTAVLGLETRVTSAGTLTVASGATLGGAGIVTNAIGGAGLVSPGNSPGILTAGSLDPSAGTDFIFEITGTAPSFAPPRDASVNDVLRLTDLSTPFASNLGSINVVNVLFSLSGTAPVTQGTYTGGFFTDSNVNFFSSISSGSFAYWVSGTYGTGADQQQFAVGPDGSLVTYSRLGAFDPALSVQRSVVPQTVTVTGQITQFVVVPEPTTLALAGIGTALVGWQILRRRRQTDSPKS